MALMVAGHPQPLANKLAFHQYARSTDGGATVTGVSDYTITGTIPLELNTWYHGAVTVDRISLQVSLYVNGVLDKTAALDSTIGPASFNSIMIGGCGNDTYSGQRMFKGRIASVSHYNRVLTAGEIFQNFSAQRERYQSIATDGLLLSLDAGLSTSYPGTGYTWYDLSGQGNNGTLVRYEYYRSFGLPPQIREPSYSSNYGGVIEIDTANAYVTAAVDFQGSNQFTVSMWVLNSYRLVGGGDFLTERDGNLFSIGTEQFVLYTSRASGPTPWVLSVDSPTIFNGIPRYSSTVIDLNTWYNLVVVYTGTAFEMFVNGQSIYATSTNINSVGLNTEAIGIGGRLLTDGAISASYSAVQVYNKALTANKILQNFSEQRGRYGI
jgi:hypothetical protein